MKMMGFFFTSLNVPLESNSDLMAIIGMGIIDATPRHHPKPTAHVG